MKKLSILLVAMSACLFSIKSIAQNEATIKPKSAYQKTFQDVAEGTFRLSCRIEHPTYQKHWVDMRITVNGYESHKSLNERFNIYFKDFIKPTDNKVVVKFDNLDEKYQVILNYCHLTRVFS